jgi:hypothetical protein
MQEPLNINGKGFISVFYICQKNVIIFSQNFFAYDHIKHQPRPKCASQFELKRKKERNET